MLPSYLCAECQALGIIATIGGPTCQHNRNAGLLWWPHDWGKMSDPERLAWLEHNREKFLPNQKTHDTFDFDSN